MPGTKVAIVGTGNVGTTLGRRLLESGRFQVKYGAPAALCWPRPDSEREKVGLITTWPVHPFPWMTAGTRPSSDKVKELLEKQPGASADSVAATVEWAEVVILATPSWDPSNTQAQIEALVGPWGDSIKGKVLIDVINSLSNWPALSLRQGHLLRPHVPAPC